MQNFRAEEKHLLLLKDLKIYPGGENYAYCYLCLNEENSKPVYALGEYHPQDWFFVICGKCLKECLTMKDPSKEPATLNNLRSRFLVFERDNFKCTYCGRSPKKDNNIELQVDHITPRARGGTDEFDNLTTACQECNLGKSDLILENRKNRKDFC